MDKMKKKFYLNINELAVLMANSGITCIYGMGNSLKPDIKDICISLHNLYKNKLIDNHNQQGFVISEEIKSILANIKAAKYIMTVEGLANDKYMMCCYLGNEISVVLRENKLQEKLCVYTENLEQLVVDLENIAQEDTYELKLRLASDGGEREKFIIHKDTIDGTIEAFIRKYYCEGGRG